MTRRLNRLSNVGPAIRVEVDDQREGLGASDIFAVTVRREGQNIVVGCDLPEALKRPRSFVPLLSRRPSLYVKLLSKANPSINSFSGTIGDFCPGGLVGYSSNDAQAILVPDADFFATRGYEAVRRLAASSLPWSERSSDIVWRGSTTGVGRVTDEDMSASNLRLIQRVRMCLLLKGVPGVDVAFAGSAQPGVYALDSVRLEQAGIFRELVPLSEWTRRRFAIDIDGFTNAWSNLFNRLLLGCCIIKIASQYGFRQWYYDDLVPWRHYVPVKPDMSDLLDKLEWCRGHLDECEAMAAEGQRLAMEMTFERELERGVATINRAFGLVDGVPLGIETRR